MIRAVKSRSHRRCNAVEARTGGMLWEDVNRRALEYGLDRAGARLPGHSHSGGCLCHSWDQGSTVRLLAAILRA